MQQTAKGFTPKRVSENESPLSLGRASAGSKAVRGFTAQRASQKKNPIFSFARERRQQTQSAGFTLIELLVVIAIIGMLSSIVLASMNSARAKGYKAAALESGHSLLNIIAMCDIDGGKITVPNSATAPTNSFCTTGTAGNWPKPPQGWQWYLSAWTTGPENLMLMTSTTNGDQQYCGYYPPWGPACAAGGTSAGFCKSVNSYGCPYYNSTTGYWE